MSENSNQSPTEELNLDVAALLRDDLERTQKARRRHFAPAIGIVFLLVVAYLGGAGIRSSLWEQPTWQIITHFVQWTLALLIFPAIGVGVLFPPKWLRTTLAVSGLGSAILAAFTWPKISAYQDGLGIAGCAPFIVLFGASFLALGAFSGAFEQRRRNRAVLWIAGAVALAAEQTVAWHCPGTDTGHVLLNHLGVGVVVLLLSALLGFWMHRRRNA